MHSRNISVSPVRSIGDFDKSVEKLQMRLRPLSACSDRDEKETLLKQESVSEESADG